MLNKLNGLYVITDNELTPNETILSDVENILKYGVKIIQLRDKKNDFSTKEELALKIQDLCKKYNALFIMNDDFELCIKHKFDGLHIGKSDYDNIEKIRNSFDGIIGVSCYDDVNVALKMQKLGIDYVAFGSFFTSPTKPNSKVVPISVINEAINKLQIPICAIGGITSENMHEFENCKPNMLAVISDIWTSKNLTDKCEDYKLFFKGIK